MPRFSGAFSRRKSTSDELQNACLTPLEPAQSSFRVLERTDAPSGSGFQGGARGRPARGSIVHPPGHQLDVAEEDNIFAGYAPQKGSGGSHTTKGTSTDNSSRHSNASTAPSSADMTAGAYDDRRGSLKKNLTDGPNKSSPKGSAYGFLKGAGRTFSFGGQKKSSIPLQDPNDVPEVPDIPAISYEDEHGRARAMTASTESTATPPKVSDQGLDLGGDFSSMFSKFDKRASNATLMNMKDKSPAGRSLTDNRTSHPAPLSLDHSTSVSPPLQSWNSQNSNENLLKANADPDSSRPFAGRSSPRIRQHPSAAEDDDTVLLRDSLAAGRLLDNSGDVSDSSTARRWKNEDDSFTVVPMKSSHTSLARHDASAVDSDNMFENGSSLHSRPLQRQQPKPHDAPKSKVMTAEQFEQYRRDKERQARLSKASADAVPDEDDVNYDEMGEDDEAEKAEKQAKQRRQQQAHLAVYRQQMMKITGEPAPPMSSQAPRPGLGQSLSMPMLVNSKTPSPDPSNGGHDEDDDEEVPLAILQAHGFPSKSRAPSRLTNMGSNPNLRASAVQQPQRPSSAMGESSAGANQRSSNLPAFARKLPQDPFVGASISRPAIRESMTFGVGGPAQAHGPMPPGGLVGVIASEERSRAMRRGSPNTESQRLVANAPANFDPLAGIPSHMMYNMGQNARASAVGIPGVMPGGMGPGMPHMQTQGEQTQMQINQQMQQFLQLQIQWMQMMSGNQQGGPMPPAMPQGPFGGGLHPSQSMADFSGRQSMMGDHMANPHQLNPGMRTMSMVQPNFGLPMPQPGFAPSIHGAGPGPGYTPSIAPSERSNIGLPGRYRPVSHTPSAANSVHQRANTMSGALSSWGDSKGSAPTIKVVNRSKANSDDDDDEQGWEAMKTAREQKKAQRKNKKGGILSGF